MAHYYGVEKSLKRALELKKQGNTQYKKKSYRTAVKCYTEALFNAPWPVNTLSEVTENLLSSCISTLSDIVHEDLSANCRGSKQNEEESIFLLPQCYGNRSAALYELGQYEAVITDIEQAIFNGYQKPSVYKLYRRRILCLAHLGKVEEAEKALLKCKEEIDNDELISVQDRAKYKKDILSINTSAIAEKEMQKSLDLHVISYSDTCIDIPFVSKSISMTTTPEKGRCLQANEDIEFTKCLMLETPYVALLSNDYKFTHCCLCFKESSTLIPCVFCIHTGYCSNDCMRKAWSSYHWLECKFVHIWNKMHWITKLSLRILLNAPRQDIQLLLKQSLVSSLDSVIQKIMNLEVISGEYETILNLVSHKGQYSDDTQRYFFENELVKPVIEVKDLLLRYYGLDSQSSDSLIQLLQYHMLQLRFNTNTVSVNTLSAISDGRNVRDVIQQKLGSAVYLTASLFNHSCDANVFFRYEGNHVRVMACAEAIMCGEELFHCYGPQLGRVKRNERQKMLKLGYLFNCRCKACYNPTKELLLREHAWDGLSCSVCHGLLPVPEDLSQTSKCIDCGKVSNIGSLEKKRDKARQLFSEATSAHSLPGLLHCEELQSKILHEDNLELARTRDTIAFSYVTEGNIDTAIPFSVQSFNSVTNIFGSLSIEMSDELCKVVHLLFQSGNIDDAVRGAMNIIPILELYHGPDHCDVIQLKQLLETSK